MRTALRKAVESDTTIEVSDARVKRDGPIERPESSNEELRVSNEEVVSINEDLKSMNEELESC